MDLLGIGPMELAFIIIIALIFVFLYLAMEAMSKAGKPKNEIRPASNAAWSMKDQPPGGNQNGEPR